MKKLILLLLFTISGIYGHSQTEYSDQYLGWIDLIAAVATSLADDGLLEFGQPSSGG